MVPIDVCRLNGRAYIQATQMMARACDRFGSTDSCLLQAKFVGLTSHRVGVALAGSHAQADDVVGTIRLRQGFQDSAFHLLALPELAPSVSRPPTIRIRDQAHDGDLTGHCGFDSSPSLEGVLDGLVQGIKSLHEGLPGPVHDIWFTGLRGFELPLDVTGYQGAGWLKMVKVRVKSDGARHQSLINVTISLNGIPTPFNGLVSFAFACGARDVA